MKITKSFLLTTFLCSVIIFSGCQKEETEVKEETTQPNSKTRLYSEDAETYSLDEIEKHKTKNDCWMAVKGNVYDVTDYIKLGKHKPIIIEGCGLDATDLFADSHEKKPDAYELLDDFYIGTLK